jgi:hypothetical protein
VSSKHINSCDIALNQKDNLSFEPIAGIVLNINNHGRSDGDFCEGDVEKQRLSPGRSTRTLTVPRSGEVRVAGSEGVIKSKENQGREQNDSRPKDRSRCKTFPEDAKCQRHSEEGHQIKRRRRNHDVDRSERPEKEHH